MTNDIVFYFEFGVCLRLHAADRETLGTSGGHDFGVGFGSYIRGSYRGSPEP